MIGNCPELDELAMEGQKLDSGSNGPDLPISSELAVSSEDVFHSQLPHKITATQDDLSNIVAIN